MKDRLLRFINDQQITSSKLAEQTGVQRSSISHMLSGRNKPGFDFIHNLMKQYPELNPEWLILGKGSMYKDQKSNENNNEIEDKGLFQKQQTQDSPPAQYITKNNADKKDIKDKTAVEKIVVFYKDRSFKEYKPNSNE